MIGLVELRNSQRRVRLDTRRLRRHAQICMEHLGLGRRVLSILLTDDRRMGRLHGRWMADPRPTDVLSFPARESRPVQEIRSERALPPPLLGDIAISVETAARRRPRDVFSEAQRYLVHGLLHLAGYDHLRRQERRRMERQARSLLTQLRSSERNGGGRASV